MPISMFMLGPEMSPSRDQWVVCNKLTFSWQPTYLSYLWEPWLGSWKWTVLFSLEWSSLFGGVYPLIALPTSHVLICSISNKLQYCQVLETLVTQDMMADKLCTLLDLSGTEYQQTHNSWDHELDISQGSTIF